MNSRYPNYLKNIEKNKYQNRFNSIDFDNSKFSQEKVYKNKFEVQNHRTRISNLNLKFIKKSWKRNNIFINS